MDTGKIAAAWIKAEANKTEVPAFTAAAIEFASVNDNAALANASRLYAQEGTGRTTFQPIAGEHEIIGVLSWALERPKHTAERQIAATALAVCALPVGLAKPEDRYMMMHASIQKAIYEKDAYEAHLRALIRQSEFQSKMPFLWIASFIAITILIYIIFK